MDHRARSNSLEGNGLGLYGSEGLLAPLLADRMAPPTASGSVAMAFRRKAEHKEREVREREALEAHHLAQHHAAKHIALMRAKTKHIHEEAAAFDAAVEESALEGALPELSSEQSKELGRENSDMRRLSKRLMTPLMPTGHRPTVSSGTQSGILERFRRLFACGASKLPKELPPSPTASSSASAPSAPASNGEGAAGESENKAVEKRLARCNSYIIDKEAIGGMPVDEEFTHEDSFHNDENATAQTHSCLEHVRHALKHGGVNSVSRFLLDVEKTHPGECEVGRLRGRHAPRLLNRNAPSHQTLGRMNIKRIRREQALFLADLFHVVIELSNRQLIAMFAIIYAGFVFIFACFYMVTEGGKCGSGLKDFCDAVFLSIETMLTIGYGVPDPYFRGCPWLMVVIFSECLVSIFCCAMLTGLIYTRISRGTTRASTILFSDKAVLRTIRGQTYFMFQVCEMRRTQLIECHLRCYFFHRPRLTEDKKKLRQWNVISQRQMRLEQPDDAMGGMLLLVLPYMVVHRCDIFSPFRNPLPPAAPACPLDAMSKPFGLSPPQRESDCTTGQRDGAWCEVCGESFQHSAQLRAHVEAQVAATNDNLHDDLLEKLSDASTWESPETGEECRQQIRKVMEHYDFEVVCILEGTDAVTSSSVQARMSYTVDDIEWDHDFAPCVCTEGDQVVVDFSHYHQLTKEVRDVVGPRVSPHRVTLV